jgi:hypothetical protein
MPVSRQEGILNRVLSVVLVAHVAMGPSVKHGQISRNNVLKLRRVLFANVRGVVLLVSGLRLQHLHVVDDPRSLLSARMLPIIRA